jgi:cytoplasmic tRNA 2-thiolation protein 1
MSALTYLCSNCFFRFRLFASLLCRNYARELVKDLERVAPQALLQTILSAEAFQVSARVTAVSAQKGVCSRCGYISSQSVCKACLLVEELNTADSETKVTGHGRAAEDGARRPQKAGGGKLPMVLVGRGE